MEILDIFFGVDWRELFVPQLPLLEVVLRGSIMYLGLFVLLRLITKRESGSLSITDLLVVVLLADAAQNAMAGSYETITEGIILVTTIIFWSYALNWLGYHLPWAERLIYPRPLLLVQNGEILWENLRRELITEDELMSQLRQQDIDNLGEIKEAYLEGDGQISVIKRDGANGDTRPRRRNRAG